MHSLQSQDLYMPSTMYMKGRGLYDGGVELFEERVREQCVEKNERDDTTK